MGGFAYTQHDIKGCELLTICVTPNLLRSPTAKNMTHRMLRQAQHDIKGCELLAICVTPNLLRSPTAKSINNRMLRQAQHDK